LFCFYGMPIFNALFSYTLIHLIQGCFGATIGKAKQAAKTEIEKLKVSHLLISILYSIMYNGSYNDSVLFSSSTHM